MAFSVYEYSEFPKLIVGLKNGYPGRKSPMTFEQLAKKIGYNSPRLFAMVIRRQRVPSEKLVVRLASALNLDPEEQSYLELLRVKEKIAQGKEAESDISQSIVREMASIQDGYVPPAQINLDDFKQISEWYYPVIQHLIGSSRSLGTVDWLMGKLGDRVSRELIIEALDRSVALGVFDRVGERYVPSEGKRSVDTGNDIPSLAIKRHHAQSLQCAVNALYQVPVEDREFQSLVMRLGPEQTEDAKKFIRSFVQSFRRKFGSTDTTRVCRLNVQMFEHTTEEE